MAYPTEPCFIVECKGWDEKLMKHPVFKYMRSYETSFSETKEMRSQPFGGWHTQDFQYIDETGKTWTGEEAFKKHCEMYEALLADSYHEPRHVYINETTDGYACFGHAVLYGNFKVPSEKNVTDLDGRAWEFAVRYPS